MFLNHLLAEKNQKKFNLFEQSVLVHELTHTLQGQVVDFADRDHLRSIPILSPSLKSTLLSNKPPKINNTTIDF